MSCSGPAQHRWFARAIATIAVSGVLAAGGVVSQNKPAQNKPAQNKPVQDKPAQDTPKQDKPKQDKPKPLDPDDPNQDKPWGWIIHEVIILPRSDADRFLDLLKTKKDTELSKIHVKEDLLKIFQIHRRRGAASYRKRANNRVDIIFDLPPVHHYERHEFKGMEHLSESEVRQFTGLRPKQRLSEEDAELYRSKIRDRYRRDGYFYANVETRMDDVKRTVTFFVDEGPEVTVGEVRFRGNKSFPGKTLLRFGENLQGSAKMESTGGLFGTAYSVSKVEDDIQKLEYFYRRNGYLDAEVHLEGATPSPDRTEMNLAFRVSEGERYRVSSVDLVIRRSADPRDNTPPLYTKEEVMKEIQLKAGDFYDSLVVNRDKAALENFYGKRGHPTLRDYGVRPRSVFQVSGPGLLSHRTEPLVRVVYELVEGEPKTLREVRIHGNTSTQDRVIRRRVKSLPGDVVDVTAIKRSRELLDRTRYFIDPETLAYTRFQLAPVASQDDLVDLDIYVKEGETGQFQWGVGVSSGTGVRGNFQFQKRNFDLTKLPSSWNPGTWISEIAAGKAFHGGDQNLDLLLAPGSEFSYYRVSWSDPDIFRQHMDTIGLRVEGYKSIRIMESFDTDRLGAAIQLSRIFDETTSVSLSVRDETVRLQNIRENAPTIVWDSEGRTEIRSVALTLRLSDLDDTLHPREGYNFSTTGLLAGGPVGANENFYKLGATAEFYQPIHTDALERKHVFYTRMRIDHAETYGSTSILYPSERYYMGGSNLRGFDQRRAGPSQFGQPVGGESRFLATAEYQFPLVSTQMEGAVRHTEIIRGVVLLDFGLLGLEFNDDIYRQPRLTVGFGVRIHVPVLEVPIQLDLSWPIFAQQSDREEQLFFSFRRF